MILLFNIKVIKKYRERKQTAILHRLVICKTCNMQHAILRFNWDKTGKITKAGIQESTFLMICRKEVSLERWSHRNLRNAERNRLVVLADHDAFTQLFQSSRVGRTLKASKIFFHHTQGKEMTFFRQVSLQLDPKSRADDIETTAKRESFPNNSEICFSFA